MALPAMMGMTGCANEIAMAIATAILKQAAGNFSSPFKNEAILRFRPQIILWALICNGTHVFI
jgi:hypothetical protein